MGKVIGIAINEKKGGEMVVLSSAKASIETGIGDDHHGSNKENLDRQVTIMTLESWNEVCDELKSNLHWTMRKANILIEGVDLIDSEGHLLKIGDIFIEITGEYKPGGGMEGQFKGLKDALKPNWKGGVTGKIIKDGIVNENDQVTIGIRT